MIKARYQIYSSAILDASPDDAWQEMRDFSRALKIGFADGISDVRWVQGGSADRVPAHIEFTLREGGVVALEEVIARSEHERTLIYRTVGRFLAIEDYVGMLRFRTITDEPGRTFFETNKEFCLAEGTDVNAFLSMYNELVHQETRTVKAYFANAARANKPA